MQEYKCENGHSYAIPDQCCLTCAHCTDVFYDWQGPYLAFCDNNEIHGATHTCVDWRNENGKETIL